jgi:excisionase family DNA binding protein
MNISALTDNKFRAYKNIMRLISTAVAAEKLGVHITRVQVLIREGRLPAQKIGGSYVINESDLTLVADRKPGRPPKAKRALERTQRSGRTSGNRDGKK